MAMNASALPVQTGGQQRYAWTRLGAFALIALLASGIKGSFGVTVRPIEAEMGWPAREFAVAAGAISILIYALVTPLAGFLADRWGPRSVLIGSALLLGVGSASVMAVAAPWQLYLAVGVLIAAGAGGAAMPPAASLVMRSFGSARGLPMGIAAAALAAGPLLVIPLTTALVGWQGWRSAFGVQAGAILLAILPLMIVALIRQPERREARSRETVTTSADDGSAERRRTRTTAGVLGVALVLLLVSPLLPLIAIVVAFLRRPTAPFWLLNATFWMCGYATGVVSTFFMAYAIDRGSQPTDAAYALGVAGALGIVGALGSGWLSERTGQRRALVACYALLAVSILLLLHASTTTGLLISAALYGLASMATIPPTMIVAARIYGPHCFGEFCGWILLSRHLATAFGAMFGGYLADQLGGSLAPSLYSALAIAIVAGTAVVAITDEPRV